MLAPAAVAAPALRFSRSDADRWASFSGDYNPIHFDIEQARRLNIDRLVVHGMLALLPIRLRIARLRSGQASTGQWRCFRVMFHLPVPQDTDLELTAQVKDTIARYGLRPAGAAHDHIRVQYRPGEPPPLASGSQCRPIAADRVDAFVAAYGHALPCWMALEAAVFAELVQSKTDPIWDIVRRNAEAVWGAMDEAPMVVHASHTVWHLDDPALPDLASCCESATCTVGAVEVDVLGGHGRPSLSCRILLEVAVAGNRLLRIEVGLLVMGSADGI